MSKVILESNRQPEYRFPEIIEEKQGGLCRALAAGTHNSNGADRSCRTGDCRPELSIAFLKLLETLKPVERAVFLLQEIYCYDYNEIAGVLNKTPANCRKILIPVETLIQK